MRFNSALGMLLIVLGVLALFVRSVTYFTTEQTTGPLGIFAWDVSHPHTIFINPITGLIAVAIGAALLSAPGRRAAA